MRVGMTPDVEVAWYGKYATLKLHGADISDKITGFSINYVGGKPPEVSLTVLAGDAGMVIPVLIHGQEQDGENGDGK